MWNSITGLINEIKVCESAGATASAVAMAFVCIDTMAFLSLPPGRETQGKTDFIAWVDEHLKGHEDQPYQYRGLDVYGARCAILHAFGSESDFHDKNEGAKKFGYHNGGKHIYDSTGSPQLVILGTASFLNDVVCAVTAFMGVCQTNADLRIQVEERLPKLLAVFPVNTA